MSDSAPAAIFLSYAREDAAAAQRIAEALRSHGVEVWFDMNELRGGDSWDQKIKKQIRECALFLPIISARTQERGEGYFRREWKLAVERTHDMAEGVPFLVPVVIDDTREAGASVPEQFMHRQWTRLAGALPTPQFVEQVKRLLAAPRRPAAAQTTRSASVSASPEVGRALRARLVWFAAISVSVILLGMFGWMFTHRSPEVVPVSEPAARRSAPPTTEKASPTPDPKSIAVLPFVNRSVDKENEFFTDGIHEDILTNLARVHELRVVSRTSVMDYRGTVKKIPEIARELNVAFILEGSVQRAGNRVRVTGQLIRAADDVHLWADSYDRELTDIFAIQSELSRAIAGELKAALSPQEKNLLDRKPTSNLAAYDLFLKARAFQNDRANFNNERAQVTLLEEAVRLDPDFTAAWSALSSINSLVYQMNIDRTPARLAQARAAIDTALRLAPESAEVIHALGDFFYRGNSDYARATEQYEKLVRLQPNDPEAYHELGVMQRRQGKLAESVAHLRKTVELDPRNLRALEDLFATLFWARHYSEASEVQRRVVELATGDAKLDTSFDLAYLPFLASGSTREMDAWLAGLTPEQANSSVGLALRKEWAQLQGDLEEAIRLDRLQPYGDDGRSSRFNQAISAALVFATQGDMARARGRLGDFPAELRSRLEREPENFAIWRGLAVMEALLGHTEEAVRCAQHALELFPESRDLYYGAASRDRLALVYAWTGDKDRAFKELTQVMREMGAENVYTMKLSPMWTPLKSDPRWEALLNDLKNNAPLF